MSIIRVRKDARYFTASNEPFNDKRLSWEARGLMGYLLSKPDGWEVNMLDLENNGPAGEHKLRRMLAELRAAGYMNRVRVTLEHGKFDWITEVYESPSLNPKPASRRFSTSGSSTSGKLPDIVSTEKASTESDDDVQARAKFAEVVQTYEREIGVLTPMIADELGDAADTYPHQWILDAIHESAIQNKRGWKYCLAILRRWKAQGNQNPLPDTKKPASGPQKPATGQGRASEPRAADAIRNWLGNEGAANV